MNSEASAVVTVKVRFGDVWERQGEGLVALVEFAKEAGNYGESLENGNFGLYSLLTSIDYLPRSDCHGRVWESRS